MLQGKKKALKGIILRQGYCDHSKCSKCPFYQQDQPVHLALVGYCDLLKDFEAISDHETRNMMEVRCANAVKIYDTYRKLDEIKNL